MSLNSIVTFALGIVLSMFATMVSHAANEVVIVSIDQSFGRGSEIWHVDSVVMVREEDERTSINFMASRGGSLQHWVLGIQVLPSGEITHYAVLDGVFEYRLEINSAEVLVESDQSIALAPREHAQLEAIIGPVVNEVEPEIQFVKAVLGAIIMTMSSGNCLEDCNEEHPYNSNCQTHTEKFGCCMVDAVRASCRRSCECEEGSWFFYLPCINRAGLLFDIDVAVCLLEFATPFLEAIPKPQN